MYNTEQMDRSTSFRNVARGQSTTAPDRAQRKNSGLNLSG
jgi:hypothetical protein